MENVDGFNQRAQIISELLQGLESAKQLQNQLTNKNTFSLCDDNDNQALKYLLLIEKMMSTFDKTITIAKQINPSNPSNDHDHVQVELPHSLDVSSPISENSQPDLRASKRRKSMPRWTKTVQISQDKPICGLEGPLNDGFSWRKYGQKGIFGAKFPRGYYRCTHRHSKGCLATKQVQRSDEDLSIYQIMYRGEHSCYPGPNTNQAQAQTRPTSSNQTNYQPQPPESPQYQISQQTIQEVFVGLDPQGEVEIAPDPIDNKAQIFRCFSFKSSLQEIEPLDNYILSCSQDLDTPTTSDSNYFPTSPYRVNGTSVGLQVQTPESDMNDSNSGQDSVNNSPTIEDFEFSLGKWLDLDPNLFEFGQ